MGNEIGIFIFALILISGTSGLFFAFESVSSFVHRWQKEIVFLPFSCPYLTTRLSPLVPIFGVILYLNVICFILRTACSDPGILPRGSFDEISYLEKSSRTTLISSIENVWGISPLALSLRQTSQVEQQVMFHYLAARWNYAWQPDTSSNWNFAQRVKFFVHHVSLTVPCATLASVRRLRFIGTACREQIDSLPSRRVAHTRSSLVLTADLRRSFDFELRINDWLRLFFFF